MLVSYVSEIRNEFNLDDNLNSKDLVVYEDLNASNLVKNHCLAKVSDRASWSNKPCIARWGWAILKKRYT